VVEHAAFGARTTYRVGGTVRALVNVSSTSDLDELGPLIDSTGLPTCVLGNGSNMLVADGEHDVIGLRLTGEFLELRWHDEDGAVIVDAGAGLGLPIAARRLAREGIVGFEWAVGVPGTFGGALVMNAGGHGSDMNRVVDCARIWRKGGAQRWSHDDLHLAYRSSALTSHDLVTEATMRLEHGDAEQAQERIRDIVRWRREHQPGGANGGSVFRNPEGDFAARLIEAAGCKGLRHATAVVSEKHANFIIADVDGSAGDVYELIVEVRDRVRTHSGVTLHSEHRFLGFDPV
jgi:UDP-N-acetylmuramate dehydrogenase